MIREQPLLLLIDDDPAMVNALGALFREEGYEIRSAANGYDGLKIAAEAIPDMIIVDVVMPGIDGIEVCRSIRSRPELDETVVIHLSAQRTDGEHQAVGRAAGADAYISLPVENRELIARVNSLLHLRRIEHNLRQSETRYRTLIESIPQLVWTCDGRGECDYFSPQWRLYTGGEEGEGINWLDKVDERDREETRRRWECSIEEGTPFEMEHRILGADGSPRWFKTRGVLIRDDDADSGRRLLTSTDITDLVESKEEMVRSKEDLERTLTDLEKANRLSTLRSELAFILARSGELQEILQNCAEILCRYLDAALVRIWKFSYEEQLLVLKASAGLYTHLDGAHSRVRIGELKIGRIASTRRPHLTNDVLNDGEIGDPDWAAREGLVAFAGFPLLLEDRLIGVLALFSHRPIEERVVIEITQIVDLLAQFIDRKRIDRERKEKIEEVTRAREEITTLNEVGKSLSAELDTRRLAAKVTEAATKLTKAEFGAFFYNVEDQYGERYQLYSIAGAPEDAFAKFPMPRKTEIFSPTFDGTGVVRSDDITRDPRYGKNAPHRGMPEGHLPVASYLAVPVVSRTGDVIGGLFFGHSKPGIFTDREEEIAVSLASQAAITMDNAQLFNQLEQKVRERTAQLEESLSELEAFSYTVSHDLRAPLRVMQSYAQIIEEDYGEQLDETVRGYLGRIAASGSRLDTLIQDLLTYSRVSRANVTMHPVRLEPIIEDVLNEYPVFRETRAEIEIRSPLPKVMGDKSSLTQCFSNLVGNAVKFVPEGRIPQVRISGAARGKYAIIRIADNGIGIPEEHRDRIFRIFERATSNREFEGTGIGLAIVKKAVERMGGSISLTSIEGEGSTFELKLMRPDEAR